MIAFNIRSEFSGSVEATRFVALDELGVEPVYRVGAVYFPASVFEAIFEPQAGPLDQNPGPHWPRSRPKSVGGDLEGSDIGVDSRGDLLAIKTDTDDPHLSTKRSGPATVPDFDSDIEQGPEGVLEAEVPGTGCLDWPVREFRQRILRAVDRVAPIPRDAVEEWVLVGVPVLEQNAMRVKIREHLKWLEERKKVTRLPAPANSGTLWHYIATARMSQ